MAAPSYDIQVDQGATFEVLLSFLSDGVEFPVEVTKLRGQIKNSVFDASEGFMMEFIQVTPNTVKAVITDETTKKMEFEKGVYDVVLDYAGGSSRRILQGTVQVSLGVTLS